MPAVAQSAWRAWIALAASKERYFARLSALEERRRAGAAVTLAEQLRLEQLLREHTECTAAFRKEVAALSNADPAAHAQLVRCLGGAAANR